MLANVENQLVKLTCLYSAEPFTDIVFVSGYKLCVHTLHGILQVCFIVMPYQPSII